MSKKTEVMYYILTDGLCAFFAMNLDVAARLMEQGCWLYGFASSLECANLLMGEIE